MSEIARRARRVPQDRWLWLGVILVWPAAEAARGAGMLGDWLAVTVAGVSADAAFLLALLALRARDQRRWRESRGRAFTGRVQGAERELSPRGNRDLIEALLAETAELRAWRAELEADRAERTAMFLARLDDYGATLEQQAAAWAALGVERSALARRQMMYGIPGGGSAAGAG